ncbi:FAD/NAD(P)-binding domain-containing protein [Auricularia subglabra TFB-10046 SS5]|nr:FAD/NAD(P)-binding domain-containing protein [Auricularia subglabra TFB-10046 SS5]
MPLSAPQASKRIAIVGMGAGGISALKAIMDLPYELRVGWEVVAFEKRSATGGLWLPDDGDVPMPPEIPETPLYPSLRTNGPHPSLTIPHWPLQPETPLFAHHEDVLRYHQGIGTHFNLTSNIRFRQNVLEAEWIGTPGAGHWELTIEDLSSSPAGRRTFRRQFEHLIAAPGVSRFPRIPTFPGQHDWMAAGKTTLHSIYYRNPDPYKDCTVVVVGRGPSGWDTARNLVGIAKTVYWSGDVKDGLLPVIPGAHDVPRIVSLAGGTVRLADGRELPDVDALILATGYEVRVPFLTAGGALHEVAPGAPQPTDRLTTNSYYMHPLYEHTLSLDTRYPLGSLYFNGIVLYNPTGMCDYAQGLFAAYTIALPELLASREELYAALKRREALIRSGGVDPAHYGHKVLSS